MDGTFGQQVNNTNSLDRLPVAIRRQFLGRNANETNLDSNLRIVLYSHDTMGIGHMRRNLLIAGKIKRTFPKTSILLIAGAKEANTFSQHAGIDCLTLPSFFKKSDGTYTTRNLGIPPREVLDIRANTILAAMKAYRPDLFIVDKVPAGAGGELLPTLDWLSLETKCRCVLGLRDILDTPDKVASDWRSTCTCEVIRKHYASIWIYGDKKVYNAVDQYKLPADVADRVTFTGYLNTESRLRNISQLPYEISTPYVLCTVGGGQDGKQLSLKFIEAIRQNRRNAVLLNGPYMAEQTRKMIRNNASSVPSLKIVEFADEGDLLVKHASHVVAMGGYNTVTAILSHNKPSLIIPRVVPRREQWIRAKRLAELGFIHTQHPDEVQPATISSWLNLTRTHNSDTACSLDMNGLNSICALIQTNFPHARSNNGRNLAIPHSSDSRSSK